MMFPLSKYKDSVVFKCFYFDYSEGILPSVKYPEGKRERIIKMRNKNYPLYEKEGYYFL
jgi:hypothetical protein